MSWAVSILSALAGWGPDFLAAAVGVILALVNMKRMRPAGLFVLLGFVGLLIVALLSITEYIVSLVVSETGATGGMTIAQMNAFYLLFSLIQLPFALAGWALLLVGIFRKRSGQAATPPGGGMPPGPLAPAFGQPGAPGASPESGQPGLNPAPPGPGGYPPFGEPPGPPQYPAPSQ